MKRVSILYVIISGLFIMGCNKQAMKNTKNESSIIADSIKIDELKRIVAVTDYNSTNYFIYKGTPMGFQYELLQDFADYMGIKLEVIVVDDHEEKIQHLLEGKADIIAANVTVTRERKEKVNFSIPLAQTRQVLVQRKPEKWYLRNKDYVEDTMIRNTLSLAGKKVFVPSNSAYAARLYNLQEEIGDSIRIYEADFDSDELVNQVADGKIDFTICEENAAKTYKLMFPNLDFETPVSFSQNIAWAVRPDSEILLDRVNEWLDNLKKTNKYARLYDKYFNNKYIIQKRKSDFFIVETGRVSVYDEQIKAYSKTIDWDWRLLASLIYQESRFNPTVTSFAGAYGLMQLMPGTAERFGVDTTSTPEENIYAGVRFLHWLDKRFANVILEKEERIKFVLASYNAGYGHVLDAMRLAEKNGKDPTKWEDNVDYYVLNKSNPKYFNDPVVEYGYCRGEEPYKYVYEILERYDHYRNIILE